MTTFPIGVELEIGGVWTDVTNRHYHTGGEIGPITITRGRDDEASAVAPTTATLTLDNTDGALTPRNPVSPWYPHIHRGLPCRLSVAAGDPYLLLSGALGGRATTPDNAALDITGDLFIAAEFRAPVRVAATGTRREVIAKWTSAGDQRSYYLSLDEFGRPVLFWSTDGTVTGTLSAVAQYAVPGRTAGPVSIAVHLDVNNGAGGKVVRHWGTTGTLTDLLAALTADETAVRLGAPVTTSGTTSIFASTSPLELGDVGTSLDVPYEGGIRRAQVRSGDWTGTIAANPDFAAQTVGATGFTDSAGRVWAVQGDAKITNRQHRFVGTASTIPLDWPVARRRDDLIRPGIARATLEMSGLLRQLQQRAKPLQSALRRLISSPAVAPAIIGYWPCEDGTDATRLGAVKGDPMRINGDVDPGSDDSLAASDALPSIAAGQVASWDARVPVGSTTAWAVEVFVRIPTPETSPTSTDVLTIETTGTVRRWRITINDSVVRVIGTDDDGTERENQAAAIGPEPFDHWFLLRFQAEVNGADVDWSWVIVPIPANGFSPGGGGDSGSVPFASLGRVRVVGRIIDTGPPDGMTFGHIVVTDGTLGLGWLAGADTAWAGETAAHRVWRLCREEQIPITVVGDNTVVASFRGDPMLSHPMGAQLPRPLPELLQECADTDLGILYEQRDTAGLAFRTHRSLYNQAARVTLDQTLDGLAPPFEPVLDDQRLRNSVIVKRVDGGSSQPAVDLESIDDEGLYDEEHTLSLEADEQADGQAGWRLHLGTWPELRLPGIGTNLEKAGPAVVTAWLDSDLGDRVVADNLPRQYDRTVAHLLEGYEESLWWFGWDATLVGSPAGPWEVGVRNDSARGKRDTAGSTLAAGIDGDDTSLSVATTLGPLWSTAGGDVPFDLELGGEQIRVTAISGGSSPQTFTVTRSVNGVVKSHSTGATVRLWRPTIRAL